MPVNQSASDLSTAGRDRVLTLTQVILQRAQRSGWTDEALGAACGVSPRAIKSYRVEGKEPCLTNALSIVCILGSSEVNRLLSVIGYGGARPLDEPDDLDARQITATILRNASIIADAATDGRIDHTEQPACRDAADAIIAAVMPLASAGGAA